MSRHLRRFPARPLPGWIALAVSVLLLFVPASLPAGVILVEGNTYRLDNDKPVTGMWDIAEKLAYTKDVAIVVVAPNADATQVQSMLQLLGTLKVPTVLTQKADYELLRKRGVLRPTTAP